MLPVTSAGGQLPLGQWENADKLVKAAWEVYSDLDKRVRPKITENTSYLKGALDTFKKNVERFSEQTERLKHGPPFQSDKVIDDYIVWGNDFERWAKELDATANYGTVWGMFKAVGEGIANDVRSGVDAISKVPRWVWLAVPGGLLLLAILVLLKPQRR